MKPRRRLARPLALVLAGLCGACMSLQSRINGELGHRLDDGFTAAFISFGSGLVILAALLACSPRGRRGVRLAVEAARERRLAWWMYLGGAAGAFFVLGQGLVATVLGVALFTVAFVAGQTLSGLGVDVVGLGPSGRHPLTTPRVAGAAITIVAVVWAVSGGFAAGVAWWAMLLPFLAGLGTSWQQAVNGRVRIAAGSALTATFGNFLVGTAVLAIAALVHVLLAGPPGPLPAEPWLYAGGAVGCVFIAGTSLLVRSTGVLLLTLATIAGQLLAALAIDLIAPVPGEAIDLPTLGGTALALVAVAVGAWQRPGPHPPGPAATLSRGV